MKKLFTALILALCISCGGNPADPTVPPLIAYGTYSTEITFTVDNYAGYEGQTIFRLWELVQRPSGDWLSFGAASSQFQAEEIAGEWVFIRESTCDRYDLRLSPVGDLYFEGTGIYDADAGCFGEDALHQVAEMFGTRLINFQK